MYVALDRDATDRAIALARTFGARGRVLVPPEELGPKGDLNDWLRSEATGDPAAFRLMLERALAASPTPWALQIQRLPPDLAPWDLEDHPGMRWTCPGFVDTLLLEGRSPQRGVYGAEVSTAVPTTVPRGSGPPGPGIREVACAHCERSWDLGAVSLHLDEARRVG